ncbi:vea protein [Ophiostoma piceae UAMH 11346]|uniref:Vea protein n=1 Tax=Ophiostoma piceae (strain UAMH 11346) TaxID=1262450 RepID=S3D9Z4_OPHP1|nr:vea protein [Ophiostoma piceae UAMH 11346]
MVRAHHEWSQDFYTPKKSTSSGGHYSTERIQLPGPSSLFTAAASTSISSRPSSSPHASNISLPAPYTTPPPMGQTPPRLPALNINAQSQPGHLGLRSGARASGLRFSPTHSPPSGVRSDDCDLSTRQPQQSHMASYLSREPTPHCHHSQAPISSSPGAGLSHAEAAIPYPTPNSRSMHPSSPRVVPRETAARSLSPREESEENKQMSITSLLSKDSARQSSVAPQPRPAASKSRMLSPARPLPSSEYRIHVRQQPLAARSCGFGERDRRVIDPPPIVQLSIDDPKATAEEISMRLRFQFTVLYCSIWNEAGDQDYSAMPEDYRQQRRLMGTLVSSPFVGQDENGEEGCFFCFPDLSCRTPGSFRLKFALIVLDPLSMRPGASSPIMATAMSNAFIVYNAKDFPGMQASTALTKRLKEQGCLISIKKGNDKATAVHARDDSDDEAGDGSVNRDRKRVKRG